MEPTLLTSLIGIGVFVMIMYFGFKFANGKWNVPDAKRNDYLHWSNKHGKTIKRSIILISVIYGIGMLVQIISLL